jgi:hypothetical protein
VVYAEDDAFPKLRHAGGDFAVARLMQSKSDQPTGYPKAEIERFARLFEGWSKTQDVYAFFISGAKERNPAAAMALLAKLGATPATSAEADALAVEKGGAKKAVAKPASGDLFEVPEKPAKKPAVKKAEAKEPAAKK